MLQSCLRMLVLLCLPAMGGTTERLSWPHSFTPMPRKSRPEPTHPPLAFDAAGWVNRAMALIEHAMASHARLRRGAPLTSFYFPGEWCRKIHTHRRADSLCLPRAGRARRSRATRWRDCGARAAPRLSPAVATASTVLTICLARRRQLAGSADSVVTLPPRF